MTSPRNTEAEGGGPTVEQAVGPFCSALPYDPLLVFAQFPLSPDLMFTLAGGVADYSFATREDDVLIHNRLTCSSRGTVVVTREDIYNAVRGDVDTVAYLGRPSERIMTVVFPRFDTFLPDRIEQLWREHRATRAQVRQTYEERQAEQERANQMRYEQEERAADRATKMLRTMLDPEQRETFEDSEKRYFDLTGSHGTRYRIHTNGYSGNVYWLKGFPDRRYKGGIRYETQGGFCGHCASDHRGDWIPTHDHNLTQLLELRYDEIAWLKTAVRQSASYPPAYYRVLDRQNAEYWAYMEEQEREYARTAPRSCDCPECRRF